MDAVSAFGNEGDEQDVTARSLRREVEILSTLTHPNIIRYYESFHQGNALCRARDSNPRRRPPPPRPTPPAAATASRRSRAR